MHFDFKDYNAKKDSFLLTVGILPTQWNYQFELQSTGCTIWQQNHHTVWTDITVVIWFTIGGNDRFCITSYIISEKPFKTMMMMMMMMMKWNEMCWVCTKLTCFLPSREPDLLSMTALQHLHKSIKCCFVTPFSKYRSFCDLDTALGRFAIFNNILISCAAKKRGTLEITSHPRTAYKTLSCWMVFTLTFLVLYPKKHSTVLKYTHIVRKKHKRACFAVFVSWVVWATRLCVCTQKVPSGGAPVSVRTKHRYSSVQNLIKRLISAHRHVISGPQNTQTHTVGRS